MEESLRKVNNFSAIKEICRILEKPDIHYSVKKIPPLIPSLRQINPSRARARTHTHTHRNNSFGIISSRKPMSVFKIVCPSTFLLDMVNKNTHCSFYKAKYSFRSNKKIKENVKI
jgi:hypothetical protein